MNANYHYLKDDYLEVCKNGNTDRNQTFTIEQLRLLKEMARRNVYPDGRFGDNECVIWEWFKSK